MIPLRLPRDLAAFLREGKQLDFERERIRCEIGEVVLLRLDELRLRLYPMVCANTPVEPLDPNHHAGGCYLVPGVSLFASCSGYDPDGMMLWLPLERRFGTWDSSHDTVSMYPKTTTWAGLVAEPKRHINACWGNWEWMECLKPWLRCRFHHEPLHSAITPVAIESHHSFRLLRYQAAFFQWDDLWHGKVVGFEDVRASGPSQAVVARMLRDLLSEAMASLVADNKRLPESMLTDLVKDGPLTWREAISVALEPRHD